MRNFLLDERPPGRNIDRIHSELLYENIAIILKKLKPIIRLEHNKQPKHLFQ